MKERPGVLLPQLDTMLDGRTRDFSPTGRAEVKARCYVRAGDLFFERGARAPALAWYDLAITTYTHTQNYHCVRRICEKILAPTPQSVRPYSTLAWLAVVEDKPDDARRSIRQYVRVAESRGAARFAREYLLFLAEVSVAPDVLKTIGDGLVRLQDWNAATTVYSRMRSSAAN